MNERSLRPSEDPSHKRAWLTLLAVIGVSLAFGLVVLPRVGSKGAKAIEGEPAPDFVLEVISGGAAGNRLQLSSLVGKVVVLDFWASWCGPCRAQAPILEALAQSRSSEAVAVVGVNTSDERDDALAFAKSASLTYALVFDQGSQVAAGYGVRNLPTLVVIDKQGKVLAVRTRVVDQDEIERLVTLALRD